MGKAESPAQPQRNLPSRDPAFDRPRAGSIRVTLFPTSHISNRTSRTSITPVMPPRQPFETWDLQDDWTGVEQSKERRKRQNRLNQRAYRM